MRRKCWTSITLNKKQICFLDEISEKCGFHLHKKLCRTLVLRALLTAAKRLKIDVSGVRVKKGLKARILESFRQCR